MAITGSMQAPPPDASQLGNQGSGQGESTSSGSPSSTGAGAPSGAAGHDTKVFGNLQGRDPDLLFAGEKIMINGKAVTVADGDTLSSLAAKHGTTVEKLIAENKMDAPLLGKNGPNGAYYTPGGPQPAPGGSQTQPPNSPAGTNGTTAPSAKPSAPDPELQKQIDAILKKQDGNTTGILGGGLNGGEDGRANTTIKLLDDPKMTGGLTSEELAELKAILAKAPDKANGASLEPSEKYLVNKYLLNTRLYNNR
jgi:LysM repeat protein